MVTTEQTDLAALGSSLCLRHCPQPSFVDGNKRTALLALMRLSSVCNGIDFIAPDPADATAMILSLAAGEVSEEGLTRWIRDNWPAEARK